MELKEVKKHLGERVYVESKPAYNRYIGAYKLEGIMQVCELDKNGKEVWTVQIKLQELKATNCSIWIDFKGVVIKFLGRDGNDTSSEQLRCPPSPQGEGFRAIRESPLQEQKEGLRTIEDIQKESFEKLRALCQ